MWQIFMRCLKKYWYNPKEHSYVINYDHQHRQAAFDNHLQFSFKFHNADSWAIIHTRMDLFWWVQMFVSCLYGTCVMCLYILAWEQFQFLRLCLCIYFWQIKCNKNRNCVGIVCFILCSYFSSHIFHINFKPYVTALLMLFYPFHYFRFVLTFCW